MGTKNMYNPILKTYEIHTRFQLFGRGSMESGWSCIIIYK